MINNSTIYTDAQGRPIPKPERCDYPSTTTWLRAVWSWQDRITDSANGAFDKAFREALKG